jgi:hypothetical protein
MLEKPFCCGSPALLITHHKASLLDPLAVELVGNELSPLLIALDTRYSSFCCSPFCQWADWCVGRVFSTERAVVVVSEVVSDNTAYSLHGVYTRITCAWICYGVILLKVLIFNVPVGFHRRRFPSDGQEAGWRVPSPVYWCVQCIQRD